MLSTHLIQYKEENVWSGGKRKYMVVAVEKEEEAALNYNATKLRRLVIYVLVNGFSPQTIV